MVLEAEFLNPYESSRIWTYGIHLRGGPNIYQRIAIESAGGWRHDYRLGPGTPAVALRSEGSADVNRATSGRNQLRLAIIDHEGWLYINGNLQDKLDLTAAPFESARLFISREKPGAQTHFSNFSAWTWESRNTELAGQNTPTPAPTPTPTPAPPQLSTFPTCPSMAR